jgi:hypothetical protein
MNKKWTAAAIAALLTVSGVSLASALPGSSPDGRPAPSGPDPAKPTGVLAAGAAMTESDSAFASGLAEGTAGGYVFVPVDPYRTFDSRDYVDGYLLPGYQAYFVVLTDWQNQPRIPPEAVAVTFTLTATDTTGGGGYLAVFPADIAWPGNSTVNWMFDGTTIAGSGTVKLGVYNAPGQVFVLHGPAGRSGGTDFVMDITGYYI